MQMIFIGRFPTRFGFEFTPIPTSFGRILQYIYKGNAHKSIYYKNNTSSSYKTPSNMMLSSNETLMSSILQDVGYDTYMIGKWDFGKSINMINITL